jgi:hypothetical protein
MRTSNIVQKSQSSQQVSENAIAMSIDEASSVFLMDALGKLYSRPAQAALREYLSNAMDAHKSKGGTLPPIQVTLPEQNRWGHTKFVSTPLRIRDFGNGMNETEFHSILSHYGASTKRDSNALMGGFGLGAKSGFAVSDEFFMTSYQSGQGVRVRLFKDNLNQGYIEVVDRFSTSEPDGVLVEVPIPSANLAELSEEALYVDYPFFMGYSDEELEVRVSGSYVNRSVHSSKYFTPLELGGNVVGWLGKENEDNPTMYALVGKVVYTIDFGHLSSLASSKKLDRTLKDEISVLKYFKRAKVIEVPVGSLDLPSSREEITYSERSLQTLSAIIGKYTLLLQQYLQQKLHAQKTKEEVLKFLVQLELAEYVDARDLMWKGHIFTKDFFSSSSMIYAHYSSRYNMRTEVFSAKGSDLNFSNLKALSHTDESKDGIFRITVDTSADIRAVQKMLSRENIEAFLDANIQKYSNSHVDVLFIITTKNDVINDWIFNSTPLDVSAIEKAAERKEREKELASQLASQLAVEKAKAEKEEAKAEKARIKAEELETRKTREARAHANFSYFLLSGATQSHTQSSSEDYLRHYPAAKSYYWSEEEINEFATVTYGLKKISDRLEKTSLLFPFIANPFPNSFRTVIETKNRVSTNYLVQLRLFLRLFFEHDCSLIIIGKDRNLKEFKENYPEIKSGVLTVKKEIESQITDAYSPVMTAYNALPAGKNEDKSDLKTLSDFVKALDESQKSQLSPHMLDIVKNFKKVLTSGVQSGMADRYLWEVLKAFATSDDIKKNSFSNNADMKALQTQYPLLMKSNFTTYSPEIIEHLLTYINLCDNQKF